MAVKFFREVRTEVSRVVWPSLKETRTLTLIISALVGFFALYLWLVDVALSSGIRALIGL